MNFYKPAHFVVIADRIHYHGPLIIKDIGPWFIYPTVTNDAANVVESLFASGSLAPKQRLLYYDSDEYLSEIVIKDGKFAGFASVEGIPIGEIKNEAPRLELVPPDKYPRITPTQECPEKKLSKMQKLISWFKKIVGFKPPSIKI